MSGLNTTPKDLLTSPRYGLPALFEELATQGVSEALVLERAGLTSGVTELDFHERTALFRSAQALARKPETALLAGLRQKISYYGAYGYALATSETMGEAFRIGREFFYLTGSVLRVSLHIENGQGVWRSHHPEALGQVLPFVAEYWRSSQTRLLSQVLGSAFPSLHMSFPYPAPAHAHLYSKALNCPVAFNSDGMEWRFDAAVIDQPCVNADPISAQLCERYCERFVQKSGVEGTFQRELLRACVGALTSSTVNAPSIAKTLNMSVRTFYRRLSEENISFQGLVDRLLRSVALEYLKNTEFTIEQIAARCGYQDVSNFRKAFKRWTGRTPSSFRAETRSAQFLDTESTRPNN